MKKNIYCPICGTTKLTNLFITTPKGKSLSLQLTSQAQLRKSSGDICCIECKKEWNISELRDEQSATQQVTGSDYPMG